MSPSFPEALLPHGTPKRDFMYDKKGKHKFRVGDLVKAPDGLAIILEMQWIFVTSEWDKARSIEMTKPRQKWHYKPCYLVNLLGPCDPAYTMDNRQRLENNDTLKRLE